MTRSVVLLSGGLDSTTLLAERLDAGRDVLPICFDYGQRHRHELQAAYAICNHYRLGEPKLVSIPALKDLAASSGSSQLGGSDVPHGHYADESMKITVVPNRNMIMLAFATAYAIRMKAAEVCYAAHAGDHAIYPDCRPQFAEAMRKSIALCDYTERTPLLYTPFISISKAEIVQRAAAVRAPLHLTWSCYDPQPADQGVPPIFIHCGACGTCVERKEAFQLAGVTDPTEYASAEAR